MTTADPDDAQRYVVESFRNRVDSDGPHQHFTFATAAEALECARRIMDKSLRRTYCSTRSAVEWYRHWAACGESAMAPGTGFDARAYAKLHIRSLMGCASRDPRASAGAARSERSQLGGAPISLPDNGDVQHVAR
ncbi:MAG: hypothetical protein NVSMB10_15590 [Steroidobacteraceae bacterium]